MRHELHPACALWPRMSEGELLALAADIGARGLVEPIVLCGDLILDGRNREEACERAVVEPRYKAYDGNDPIGFSIAANLHRRHLSKTELSFIAESLATLKRGRQSTRNDKGSQENFLIRTVATQMGVGRSNIEAVRVLKTQAEPNVIEMARTGDVGIQAAAYYARNTSRDEQRNATPRIVRLKGNSFKVGRRFGAPQKGARKKQTGGRMITVPYAELEQFRLLIKGVKEQSRKNAATVSFTHLAVLAHKLEQLADAWADDGPEAERTPDPSPATGVRGG
jgi:hypothetical protein